MRAQFMTTKKKVAKPKPKTKRRNPVIEGLIEGLTQPPEQLTIRSECLELAERLRDAMMAGDYETGIPAFKQLEKKIREWIKIKNNTTIEH